MIRTTYITYCFICLLLFLSEGKRQEMSLYLDNRITRGMAEKRKCFRKVGLVSVALEPRYRDLYIQLMVISLATTNTVMAYTQRIPDVSANLLRQNHRGPGMYRRFPACP
jgi:hypothetical protein